MSIDQHLSETVEQRRICQPPPVDIAMIEAVVIAERGGVGPATPVGNPGRFALLADELSVEINLTSPRRWRGCTTSISRPAACRPSRTPIPVGAPEGRVGYPFIPMPPGRIAAIVVSTA